MNKAALFAICTIFSAGFNAFGMQNTQPGVKLAFMDNDDKLHAINTIDKKQFELCKTLSNMADDFGQNNNQLPVHGIDYHNWKLVKPLLADALTIKTAPDKQTEKNQIVVLAKKLEKESDDNLKIIYQTADKIEIKLILNAFIELACRTQFLDKFKNSEDKNNFNPYGFDEYFKKDVAKYIISEKINYFELTKVALLNSPELKKLFIECHPLTLKFRINGQETDFFYLNPSYSENLYTSSSQLSYSQKYSFGTKSGVAFMSAKYLPNTSDVVVSKNTQKIFDACAQKKPTNIMFTEAVLLLSSIEKDLTLCPHKNSNLFETIVKNTNDTNAKKLFELALCPTCKNNKKITPITISPSFWSLVPDLIRSLHDIKRTTYIPTLMLAAARLSEKLKKDQKPNSLLSPTTILYPLALPSIYTLITFLLHKMRTCNSISSKTRVSAGNWVRNLNRESDRMVKSYVFILCMHILYLSDIDKTLLNKFKAILF